MKPIDIRNDTWDSIQSRIREDMLAVWEAYRAHGPCTTRELATRSGIDILTARPRTSDLYKAGLVDCIDRKKKEGIYQHVPVYLARARFEKAKSMACNTQKELFAA